MDIKIVVLDAGTLSLPKESWNEINALGEIDLHDSTPNDDRVISERIRDAQIVLTNKVPLRAAALADAARLRLISVLATGYNIIDLEAARATGVTVSNVPAYSTEAVAQHTLALLLALTNRVEAHAASVEKGDWIDSPFFSYWRHEVPDLHEMTLGLIGFGEIGQRVGELGHALGMSILASARRKRNAPDYHPFAWAEIDQIFSEADVISLHCPATPETEQLVNRKRLGTMKPTAILLNTARGNLVDEEALADALKDGQLYGCGLDVLNSEPMRPDCPLRGAPRCLITPHMAWSSQQSRRRLLRETTLNLQRFLSGDPRNVVSGPARA